MSESSVTAPEGKAGTSSSGSRIVGPTRGARPRWQRPLLLGLTALVVLLVPLYLEAYWLQLGFLIAALAVGAVGLNLLTGTTGQLSLAHPFFMGLGALSYVVLAGEPAETSLGSIIGFGWPPLFAMIGGVVLAGLAGLLFSPFSARLRGLYLGAASLALVFIGVHVLNSAHPLSGGFNGRPAPEFSIFGLSFGGAAEPPVVLGVSMGRAELQWYLGAILLVLAMWFASNVLKSRMGRALKLIDSDPLAASVVGVPVMEYKGKVFFLSSVYAGLSGVMYALAIGSIAPQSFDMSLSLDYLAIIVIGGLGSVGGAVAGAAFVTGLPQILQNFAPQLGFLDALGLTTAHVSNFIYGAAIIAVLIFKPDGLAGIWRDLLLALLRRKNKSAVQSGPADRDDSDAGGPVDVRRSGSQGDPPEHAGPQGSPAEPDRF